MQVEYDENVSLLSHTGKELCILRLYLGQDFVMKWLEKSFVMVDFLKVLVLPSLFLNYRYL
jgi:hypothetical protein